MIILPDPHAIEICDSAWRGGLAPEQQITVSEWADRHRVLPPTSAEPGPWRTNRVPYLGEIMDRLSVSDPVERVVFMKGAQVGGTEAGLNWIGYIIDHAPGLTLLVMPSLDMLRRNSRTRIDPLIEETPALRSRVAPQKARERGNTIALKEFPGGQLVMTGANSPSGLRSTPVRYLFCDEIDGYPADADGEGDPIALAIQRTATFSGRRKIFLVSTPTIRGASRIEKAYAESDQRRFHVPCQRCGTFQPIEWQRIRWPDQERGKTFLECSSCNGQMFEHEKPALFRDGEWHPQAEGDGRTAGYHLSALYSPFETWAEIAMEHGAVKNDPPRLQAFVNTKLGETWQDETVTPIEAEILAARAEEFPDILHDAIEMIAAGIDTQDDRLEVEIVGFAENEESWSLSYEVLWGDPARPEVWRDLDRVLAQRFPRSGGRSPLGVTVAAIDSGGHRTPEVMSYCHARQARRIWAIKGRGGPGIPPWPKRPPKPTPKHQAPVFIIGVDGLKTLIHARLKVDKTGPGYMHFPADRDFDWYRGLTAERPVRRFVKGVAKIEWLPDPGVRNEPFDCRVYAMAARHGWRIAGRPLPRDDQPRRTVIKSGWMNG